MVANVVVYQQHRSLSACQLQQRLDSGAANDIFKEPPSGAEIILWKRHPSFVGFDLHSIKVTQAWTLATHVCQTWGFRSETRRALAWTFVERRMFVHAGDKIQNISVMSTQQVHGKFPRCQFSWEMQRARRECQTQLQQETHANTGTHRYTPGCTHGYTHRYTQRFMRVDLQVMSEKNWHFTNKKLIVKTNLF